MLGAGAEGARVGVAAEGDAYAGAVGAAVEEGLGEVVRAEVVAGEVGEAEGGVGGEEGEVGRVVVCVGVVAQGFDGEVSVGGRGLDWDCEGWGKRGTYAWSERRFCTMMMRPS